MKKVILLAAILMAGVSAAVLITKCNDHKECDRRTYKTVTKDGSVVTHTEHICNEKFSF